MNAEEAAELLSSGTDKTKSARRASIIMKTILECVAGREQEESLKAPVVTSNGLHSFVSSNANLVNKNPRVNNNKPAVCNEARRASEKTRVAEGERKERVRREREIFEGIPGVEGLAVWRATVSASKGKRAALGSLASGTFDIVLAAMEKE